MLAADEIQQVRDGLWFWQRFQPSVKVDCSSCAVRVGAGLVLVDPIPVAAEAMEELCALGVKAVVAQSFERIHRSNLCGMGVLPLQFPDGVDAGTLRLDGTETFDLLGLSNDIKPMSDVTLVIHRTDGTTGTVKLRSRIDTAIEVDYVRHGGILPFVLRQLLEA